MTFIKHTTQEKKAKPFINKYHGSISLWPQNVPRNLKTRPLSLLASTSCSAAVSLGCVPAFPRSDTTALFSAGSKWKLLAPTETLIICFVDGIKGEKLDTELSSTCVTVILVF